MSILSAQSIRKYKLVHPLEERTVHEPTNTSYGLSSAGYDVRLDQDIELDSGGFQLGSTIERFYMTDNVMGIVHDKSSWIRRGLAVQNSCIEPGWQGYLTLELTLHKNDKLFLKKGTPIAQIVFHFLDEPTEQPYGNGKYQNQSRGPQEAL